VNKKLEEVVIKTIGAFNNSRGGTLLIGVDDSGNILGLQNDYNSLKRHGRDYFELHLRNIIGESYSLEYATRNVTIAFPEVEGKEICLVTVLRGTRPIYTNTTDKNGKRVERFYVRSGNSSRELEKPSDVVAYVNDRFKDSDD
jgi:predicted HTH transcriptional regulator